MGRQRPSASEPDAAARNTADDIDAGRVEHRLFGRPCHRRKASDAGDVVIGGRAKHGAFAVHACIDATDGAGGRDAAGGTVVHTQRRPVQRTEGRVEVRSKMHDHGSVGGERRIDQRKPARASRVIEQQSHYRGMGGTVKSSAVGDRSQRNSGQSRKTRQCHRERS